MYIHISRSAITKYIGKNNKRYSLKKMKCFMIQICFGLIIEK